MIVPDLASHPDVNSSGDSAQQVETRTLRSLPELEEIRFFWERWPGNRDSDLDFYSTVLTASPQSVRPHVIVIYRGGQPDAILVGRIDSRRIDNFRMGYFRVKPKAVILYFVYGALRGNPSFENSELFVEEICKSLSRGEADLAYLNFFEPDAHIYKLAIKKPATLRRDYAGISQTHFALTLPASIEAFYKGLSPKVRKNQKWQAKKLAGDFPNAVTIKCFKDPSEVDSLSDIADQITGKSYQRGLGVGFVNNPQARERLRLKATKGWLRAYVLYLADCPCAFWMGDINRGIFGSDYLAFDPAFAKYSPGMYLILQVIEGFCKGTDEAVTGIDFATGRAQYKEILSTREWQEISVYIFAPSFKGLALNAIRTVAGGIDKGLKRVLVQTGLLQKIKKAWRARLRPAQ